MVAWAVRRRRCLCGELWVRVFFHQRGVCSHTPMNLLHPAPPSRCATLTCRIPPLLAHRHPTPFIAVGIAPEWRLVPGRTTTHVGDFARSRLYRPATREMLTVRRQAPTLSRTSTTHQAVRSGARPGVQHAADIAAAIGVRTLWGAPQVLPRPPSSYAPAAVRV